MAKRSETRNIPLKNYIIAFLIFVGVVVGCWYAFEWYKVNQEEKLTKSYIVEAGTITNVIQSYEEIEAAFSEVPEDYFIFVTYLESEEEYELEKELNEVIKDYKLQDKFYLLDVTKMKNDTDYLDKINELLGFAEYKITKVPTIVYVEENMSEDNFVVREDNNMMQAADFVHMLDIKQIKK